MFRIKDFYLKDVINEKGKKIGSTKDIYIDFEKGQVIGLKVSCFRISNNKHYLDINKIVSFGEDIVANNFEACEGLEFSRIKDFEVVDKEGNIKGELEDILIDEDSYKIAGLIISGGIIDKIIRGKEIILINQTVLKEDHILYLGKDELVVKNIPRQVNLNYAIKKV